MTQLHPLRPEPAAETLRRAKQALAEPDPWTGRQMAVDALVTLAGQGHAVQEVASDGLRPPPEHIDKPLHWVINHKGAKTVAHWSPGAENWHPLGCALPASRFDLAMRGYRYLYPAEPIDPAQLATYRQQIEAGFAAQTTNGGRLADMVERIVRLETDLAAANDRATTERAANDKLRTDLRDVIAAAATLPVVPPPTALDEDAPATLALEVHDGATWLCVVWSGCSRLLARFEDEAAVAVYRRFQGVLDRSMHEAGRMGL